MLDKDLSNSIRLRVIDWLQVKRMEAGYLAREVCVHHPLGPVSAYEIERRRASPALFEFITLSEFYRVDAEELEEFLLDLRVGVPNVTQARQLDPLC